ncbi:hypothetical protein D3C77_328220 [compost metagenome]
MAGEVFGNVSADGFHAFRCLEHHGQLAGALGQNGFFVLVQVVVFDQLLELFIDRLTVDSQFG